NVCDPGASDILNYVVRYYDKTYTAQKHHPVFHEHDYYHPPHYPPPARVEGAGMSWVMGVKGRRAWTENPPARLRPACNLPPNRATRSRMPISPCPDEAVGSRPSPAPSSRTSRASIVSA